MELELARRGAGFVRGELGEDVKADRLGVGWLDECVETEEGEGRRRKRMKERNSRRMRTEKDEEQARANESKKDQEAHLIPQYPQMQRPVRRDQPPYPPRPGVIEGGFGVFWGFGCFGARLAGRGSGFLG